MKIEISQSLRNMFPKLKLGILTYEVLTTDNVDKIDQAINKQIEFLKSNFTHNSVKECLYIKDIRLAYKELGINPDRYPISSEALLKRILTNKGIYKINNVVDLNNLISLKSFLPIGSYDLEKINGEVSMVIGNADDYYDSISKGVFNLKNFPAFEDVDSLFGSLTSDSKRTAINEETSKILTIIVSFSGSEIVNQTIDTYLSHCLNFLNAKNVETQYLS